MKAYKHLVKHALAQGHVISVWDGEEWQVSHSTGYQNIIEAIESVEEAFVKINDTTVHTVARALVSAYGLADDETVIDYSDNKFMQEWLVAYEKL